MVKLINKKMKIKCIECNKELNGKMFWRGWTICKICYEIENLTKYGNDYQSWEVHSIDLWVAADCIKEARFNQSSGPNLRTGAYTYTVASELMLRGFAFECLFKAIYLRQGNKLVFNGKMDIPPDFKNHDLKKMARNLRLNFSEDEEFYLDILTNYSKNLGRYPISKLNDPVSFFMEQANQSMRRVNFKCESDYNVINKIKDKSQKYYNRP